MSVLGLALVGVALAGCGQKGALYLPTDPAAKGRATLPELLMPRSNGNDATTGGTGAASTQPPTDASGTGNTANPGSTSDTSTPRNQGSK